MPPKAEYVITQRGSLPTDLVKKVSAAHAVAVIGVRPNQNVKNLPVEMRTKRKPHSTVRNPANRNARPFTAVHERPP